jgi:hypothetical protein
MSKKTGKFKSIDGRQTMTVTVGDVVDFDSEQSQDVEAYQEPTTSEETFTIDKDGRRLTITIAE